MRSSREEWQKRVERWKDSGLTAEQYAAELGVNHASVLGIQAETGGGGSPRKQRGSRSELPLIELQPAAEGSGGFELELGGGKRLWIPSGFDAAALERLLGVLARVQ